MDLVASLTQDVKPWLVDTAERAVKTFVQVFALMLVTSGWFTVDGIVDLSILQKAGLAAGGAALSVISSAVSKIKGPPSTASFVQPKIDEAKAEAGVVPKVMPADVQAGGGE